MNQTEKSTIILGGGFTGLFTALHLSHKNYSQSITLIDRNDRFSFNPMMYEYLSGEMSDEQVYPRYLDLLEGSGVKFVQDTATSVDLPQKCLQLASGLNYTYDNLVLALGSVGSFFGIEGAKEHTFLFRTGKQATELSRHLRECLQKATQTKDKAQRLQLLTVAIVGAGASGVELAATLADLLPIWYQELGGNSEEIRVVLINRSHEILKGSGNSKDTKNTIHDTATKALKNRNIPVEFLLGASVTQVYSNKVEYQKDDLTQTIFAATTAWTAGVTVNPLIKNLAVAEEYQTKRGYLNILPTMQLPEYPEVFAGGDCALRTEEDLPQTAQVAYQEGKAIADNLLALAKGKELSEANVSLRGTLLKLGLGESVANLFDRYQIKGKPGHLIRESTYLTLLPTPIHNFKATTGWLIDEIFEQNSSVA
ncbi:FAD-dependent pyridine nucleotide-disulfide oxidoreductase [Hyella patelloides LEGE 07179]|uniref:FAD-dependent pyridine nucleotide-disulfide oxidoreductase n=1 Tax=Hyella patelloides LEGE 07179 TaxID=945734 RepID=A0A563VTR5_9CYAN|nr:NAD(P)/FAD-dependent oxidoreductase [Hyella patelloides]VEP14830.1 FAD-dependent pyridine nucleotide-disulfide oxidoreductase [Hyella patelloides LEGE 07179]